MKPLFIFLFIANISFAQKIETIKIPKGVVYNYCDNKIIEKAKKLIVNNLSESNDYELLQSHLIIGPELWKRFKDSKKIQSIEKGNVTFHIDNLALEGKMSQSVDDSKIIWDELRNEVTQDYIIRKANEAELNYYWATISFDIDEPLLIVETKEHQYILNITKDDLKLMWLDEVPPAINANNAADSGFKTYQNGKEVDTLSKGIKETALEKVILLSSDEELKKNTSVEDLTAIVDKTNKIFEELFKNSDKSGKIMVHFEIKKKKNEIHYAVRDDLDLDIMKEFEKRVNSEKFPNSKKNPIQIQLIYKVNSFNDTE